MSEIPAFVHLHNHTEFSLLDGACRVKDMINKAKELGMDSIALTDHGNMYAVVPFYNYAKKVGIKPIIGCEVYLSPRSMHQKEGKQDARLMHLVLLAKNETGYVNLMRLVSLGNTEGFYYKPRVDFEAVKAHSEGLVALSACMAGPIAVKILEDDYESALNEAKKFHEVFGEDFYLEIQDHGIEGQKAIISGLIKINKELGIPIVATNDIHYLNKEDAHAQDVLLCISTGKKLADTNRMKFSGSEFYLKPQQEMADLFSYLPESISNTVDVANKCNLEIEQGVNYLPKFPIPEGHTKETYLEALAWKGIDKRYPERTDEIKERLRFEMDIINKMEFPAYFLITADFIEYARNQGISVGPGRGSAAGSLVAYSLGITNLDPLKYDLLFERFLNPERVTMPDVDIDFCIERRQEVIEYVGEKYGRDYVAQIVTFGTMAARGVVRDVGRVMDIPLSEVDRIAKMIPAGPGVTLKKSLEEVPEFKAYYENNRTVNDLIKTCLTLEGVARHSSTHAAGVVISKFPLTQRVPVFVNDGQLVTQYPKDELEMVGLLKMDFLGLRNLTMISNALRIIKETKGVEIDIDHIPMDDDASYELLCRADTTGVFQLESKGMKKLLRNLKPSVFEDVIALLALYRPGPLGSGMDVDFVNRKHGKEKVSYMMPQLEPILKDTYGTILYQEQIMRIAQEIGGFTLGGADVLRRAMGKKKMDVMLAQKEKFVEGAIEKHGANEKVVRDLFDMLVKFAEYGFNKSHSAAYAVITYQTAYLKAHYPVEFMAALVSSMIGSIEKVSFYVQECRTMGIDVLTPDINESLKDFTVVSGNIRFGLSAIRNVGDAALDSIIEERQVNGIYRSMHDLCNRVDLRVANKRVFESLIKAGALDTFGNRRQMLSVLDNYVLGISRDQRDKENGLVSLFAPVEESSKDSYKKDEFPDIEDMSEREKLKLEKEMLGIYISDHPLNHLGIDFSQIEHDNLLTMKEKEEGEVIKVIGMVNTVRKILTKAGKNMLVAEVEDLYGVYELVLFPFRYEANADKIYEDALIIAEGKLSKKNDEYKILCESVTPLQEGGRHEKTLNIEIEAIEDADILSKVREVLLKNSGSTRVLLHTKKAKIEVGDKYRVKITPTIAEEIGEIVGMKRVYESEVAMAR